MAADEPSQFYTGLVAELYGPLRSVVPDPEPYARFIARSGEPALELGCGDGDPLLELRARGIDVEGLDSSADMLGRCRLAAQARGLDVVLHEQPMEAMHLGRQYQSIFIAGPTFNLLPDDDIASHALARIAEHLRPGGSALIPLFVPPSTPAPHFGKAKTHTTAEGVEMRVTPVREHRDDETRRQTTVLRYERISATGAVSEDRPWLIHWYTQAGFRDLATAAGLTVSAVLTTDGLRAGPDDESFVFLLARPRT